MNAPLYTVDVLRLAASLPEAADLERVDGSAELRSPTCGSVVSSAVTLDPDGRIEALSQRVQACAFGQASAAVVAGHAQGRDRAEVESALASLAAWLDGRSDVPAWPAFEALAPARSRKPRHAAILLPLRALLAAMSERR